MKTRIERALPLTRSLLAATLLGMTLAACGSGDETSNPAPTGNTGGGNDAPAPSPGGGTETPPPPAPGGGSDTPAPPVETPKTFRPVLYVADQDKYEITELYLVDAANATPPVKLNAPLVTGGYVEEHMLSPKQDAAFYIADAQTLNRYEVFMVKFDKPGVAIRINPTLTVNRDVFDFKLSPDGTKVLFRSDLNADEVYDLFITDITTPGVATKVNAPLVAGGWVRAGYQFSPDGTKVLYRADQDQYDVTELYVVNLANPGVSQQVNPQLIPGGNVYTGYEFSPDGARIAYIADQNSDEVLELYGAATSAPGVTQKLSGTLVAGGDVCRFEFSPDSQRVAYCADQTTNDVEELYTVTFAAPGASVKLNPPLASGGKVTAQYAFTSDSSAVVYQASQDSASREELYRVAIAAPGVTSKLNKPLVAGGNVVGFQMNPNGTNVSYVANQDTASAYELYDATLALPHAVTRLSPPMTTGGVYWFEFGNAGKDIAYAASQDSDSTELYLIDSAVPGISRKLSAPLTAGGEVWDFSIAK